MNTVRYIIAVAIVAAASQSFAQQLTAEQAAQVIARVGNEEITAGEFERDMQVKLQQIQATTGRTVQPDMRMRRALLGEMINNRVLNIAARNSGIAVSDEEVEADFQERKEVFDSEEKYQSYLQRNHLTEEKLKEGIRTRIQVRKFVDQEAGELTASAEEVQKAYDGLSAQGKMRREQKTRDLAVMLFRAKGGSDEAWRAAEERAQAARARLDAGEAFDAVAREVSEDPDTAPRGGLLPEMRVGSFYPELETVIDTLKVDEVSAPTRSVMGWYLIKLVRENEPGAIPLEVAREALEREIIEGKRGAVVRKIVEDSQKLLRIEIVQNPDAPPSPAAPEESPAPAPGAPAPKGAVSPAPPAES